MITTLNTIKVLLTFVVFVFCFKVAAQTFPGDFTTTQINQIIADSSAAEGDLYRDKELDFYYLGTSGGSLLQLTGNQNWRLDGNTLNNNHFLGSINDSPIRFRTDNRERVSIGINNTGNYTNIQSLFKSDSSLPSYVAGFSQNIDLQSGSSTDNVTGIDNLLYHRSGSKIANEMRAMRNRLWNIQGSSYSFATGIINDYRGEGTEIKEYSGFENTIDLRAGSYIGSAKIFNSELKTSNGKLFEFYGLHLSPYIDERTENYYGVYQGNIGSEKNRFAFLYDGDDNDTYDVAVTGRGRLGVGTKEPTNRVEIDSKNRNSSGLTLTRLTSSSPFQIGRTIGVDANGNVIPVTMNNLSDTDNDTYIDVEATNDNDQVQINLGGALKWSFVDNRIENTNTNNSIYIGRASGAFNGGDNNVALGMSTLRTRTSSSTTAIGDNAGENNNSNNNVFVGRFAGQNSGAAQGSVYIGYNAGQNLAGRNNVSIGFEAGKNNNNGSNNIFMGFSSGLNNQGSNNIALGEDALKNSRNGSNNVAIGQETSINGSGSNNIIIGHEAAKNIGSGSRNIVIGSNIDIMNSNQSSQLNIGNYIFGTGLSSVGGTISNARLGLGVKAPGDRLEINAGTADNSGLRFTQLDANSPPTAAATAIGVDNNGTVVSVGSSTYIGYFIINSTGTLNITGLPFKPSSISFSAKANIDSDNINGSNSANSNNDRTKENVFGSMDGFATNNGGTITQLTTFVGGSGASINNITRYSSSANCIGVRYADHNGSSLGLTTARVTSFNSDGFTLNVGSNTDNLLVIYTAHR